MGATSLASDMRSAVNYIGAGVETQGRALRSTVRHMTSADVTEPPCTSTPERQASPLQLLSWVATAFAVSASFLRLEASDSRPAAGRVEGDYLIVDKYLTRC